MRKGVIPPPPGYVIFIVDFLAHIYMYAYIPEQLATPINDFFNDITLTILCYSINTELIYPFLQFMLLPKTLTLPTIQLNYHDNTSLQSQILTSLSIDKLTSDMYKGIIYLNNIPYALVNISNASNANCIFALTNEIINNRQWCNKPIDPYVCDLFTHNPCLGTLIRPNKTNIMLPDIGYLTDINIIDLKSTQNTFDLDCVSDCVSRCAYFALKYKVRNKKITILMPNYIKKYYMCLLTPIL